MSFSSSLPVSFSRKVLNNWFLEKSLLIAFLKITIFNKTKDDLYFLIIHNKTYKGKAFSFLVSIT